MEKRELKELLERYKVGECNERERSLLESWYLQRDIHAIGHDLSAEDLSAELLKIEDSLSIVSHPDEENRKRKNSILWYRVAAAVVLFALGIYMYGALDGEGVRLNHADTISPSLGTSSIMPGSNKAVLTMGDGRKVDLDSFSAGEIGLEDGVKISKTADGQIAYEVQKLEIGSRGISYNTIETPKGGQYRVVLPDGSSVWLNSSSSLRYPNQFVGNNRYVELEGEAYFEIKKYPAMPFVVLTAKQEVTVLGTHFNVEAYADEPVIKTTLLEGSVQVAPRGSGVSQMLKPNEQAILRGNTLTKQTVDGEEAVAWKNGLFVFNDEPLEVIMRKIARWYDVTIVYDKNVNRQLEFGGEVSRYSRIDDLLQKLELTKGIHFKIEGRQIFVTK